MKRKLTKAEYDALTPEMKLLYVAEGEFFKLPLVDDDDPDALRRALDREKLAAKTATERATAMQTELDTLRTDPARKTGDLKVIEDSWRQKVADAELAGKTATEKLTATLNKTLIEREAAKVAAAITDPTKPGNASLMIPHIISRFEVVMDGDTPLVKIKDATGRVSAMNSAELEKELVGNPTFSTIVVASKASGAGGTGGSGSGSANGGAGGAGGAKKFGEMSGPEKTALFKSDPAYFNQLAKEHKETQQATRFLH
jgi:hypothetical protein